MHAGGWSERPTEKSDRPQPLMRQHPNMRRGFTLIEVLVALFVIAITLAAFMQSFGQNVDTTLAAREHTIALWIAQNHLTSHYIAHDWPETNTTEGTDQMAGHEWQWREIV